MTEKKMLFCHDNQDRGLVNVFTSEVHQMNKNMQVKKAFHNSLLITFLSSQHKRVQFTKRNYWLWVHHIQKQRRKHPINWKKVNKWLNVWKVKWHGVHIQASLYQWNNYSIYPRALADENSNPHKSPKSNWTNKLKMKYESKFIQVFATELSSAPELVIIDAMFIMNTKPLRNIRSIVDYASFYLQGLWKSIVQKEYRRYIYFLTN